MTIRIQKRGAIGSLSLTPLIDIVFLLLIFFLVATRFSEEDRELNVDLPTASQAQPLVAEKEVTRIYVDRDGRFFVGDQLLDQLGVERSLRQTVANNPGNHSVKIAADQRCAVQAVVTVFDLCHKVGVSDYSLATAGDGNYSGGANRK